MVFVSIFCSIIVGFFHIFSKFSFWKFTRLCIIQNTLWNNKQISNFYLFYLVFTISQAVTLLADFLVGSGLLHTILALNDCFKYWTKWTYWKKTNCLICLINRDNLVTIELRNSKFDLKDDFDKKVLNLSSTFLAKLYFDQNCHSKCTSVPIRTPDLTKGRSKRVEVKRSN